MISSAIPSHIQSWSLAGLRSAKAHRDARRLRPGRGGVLRVPEIPATPGAPSATPIATRISKQTALGAGPVRSIRPPFRSRAQARTSVNGTRSPTHHGGREHPVREIDPCITGSMIWKPRRRRRPRSRPAPGRPGAASFPSTRTRIASSGSYDKRTGAMPRALLWLRPGVRRERPAKPQRAIPRGALGAAAAVLYVFSGPPRSCPAACWHAAPRRSASSPSLPSRRRHPPGHCRSTADAHPARPQDLGPALRAWPGRKRPVPRHDLRSAATPLRRNGVDHRQHQSAHPRAAGPSLLASRLPGGS